MPNVHSFCIGLRKFEVLLSTVNINANPRPIRLKLFGKEL